MTTKSHVGMLTVDGHPLAEERPQNSVGCHAEGEPRPHLCDLCTCPVSSTHPSRVLSKWTQQLKKGGREELRDRESEVGLGVDGSFTFPLFST